MQEDTIREPLGMLNITYPSGFVIVDLAGARAGRLERELTGSSAAAAVVKRGPRTGDPAYDKTGLSTNRKAAWRVLSSSNEMRLRQRRLILALTNRVAIAFTRTVPSLLADQGLQLIRCIRPPTPTATRHRAQPWRHDNGRGSNPRHARSCVDAAGRDGATLIFSVVVRDGSMRWRSGDAAGEWP
jgi:hypothetical protein